MNKQQKAFINKVKKHYDGKGASKNIAIGNTQGLRTPIYFLGYRLKNKERGGHWWVAQCACGNISATSSYSLRKSASCGCLTAKVTRKRNLEKETPRLSTLRVYDVYRQMMKRCHDKDNPAYPRYGGRGIKVSKKWKKGVQYFIEDMGDRPVNWTLDRIDNNKNYTKGNCRWCSYEQQAQNKNNNKLNKDMVLEARELREKGYLYKEIKERISFPGTLTALSDAVRGKTWGNIK